MKTRLTPTPLRDCWIVEIDYFKDERGFFLESWSRRDFTEAGLADEFVQDSHSSSTYGVLRGLHYQNMRAPLAKLVRCTVGRILDVAVDLRAGSSTFGKWYSVELTSENKKQLYIPVGFAHGFATLSDYCEVQYKQTGFYDPKAEGGIAWNDPDLAIAWPYPNPILSARDQAQPNFAEYRRRPAFEK